MMIKVKLVKSPQGVIEQQIIKVLEKKISRTLGNMHCPKHLYQATVEIEDPFDHPKVQIEGCCGDFINRVTEVLRL
jgi:hypothetical protein